MEAGIRGEIRSWVEHELRSVVPGEVAGSAGPGAGRRGHAADAVSGSIVSKRGERRALRRFDGQQTMVGIVGEVLARRRTPDGLLGAILVGFIAIFLIVGIFHFAIAGEPKVAGVPLISSVIAAAILVALWSGFAYQRVHPYYSRYSRRDSYARRPRRRLRALDAKV